MKIIVSLNRSTLFIISILTLLQFTASCGEAVPEKTDSTAVYYIDLPHKGLDAPDFSERTITLSDTVKYHKIDLGVSTTKSKFEMFREGSEVPEIIKEFAPNEPRLVDISVVEKRRYLIRMTGIAEGYTFTLNIK